MKKYKNLILVTMVSGILGVFMGFFSEELSEVDFTFTGNINNYIFKIFLGITCILTIYLL
ncbi:MAG: hypothetical protein ACREV6_07825 [Clostridium sp.]|uniref:hypothetical protein n=1 Tax=Clostridium sp. TaxID=1506 RepID=UPI003D6D80B1